MMGGGRLEEAAGEKRGRNRLDAQWRELNVKKTKLSRLKLHEHQYICLFIKAHFLFIQVMVEARLINESLIAGLL
jgi:hypothetical protein